MAQFLSTARLANVSARHPWRIIGLWVAIFLLAGYLATGLGDVLTSEMTFVSKPESIRAADLIEERLRGPYKARELVIRRGN